MILTMFNHSNKSYEVGVGDRIAQIVFHRTFVLCDELSKTERELGGFGSTGN